MPLTLTRQSGRSDRYDIQEIPGLTLRLRAEGWQIWICHQGPTQVAYLADGQVKPCSQNKVIYPAGIYHSRECFRQPCPDYQELIKRIEEVLLENPRLWPEQQRSR